MSYDFKGKNVVTAGRLKHLSKDDLRLALKALGAYPRKTLRSTTHFMIASGTSRKRDRAKYFERCTVLTEDEFIAFYAQFKQNQKSSQTEVPNNEALSNFRALLYEVPTPEIWDRILEQLDACTPELLPLALDYIGPLMEGWPDPSIGPDAYVPHKADRSCQDLRMLWYRHAWYDAILSGETSPKFRVVRVLRLFGKLNGTTLSRVVTNPNLAQLRGLHFADENKPAIATYQKLAQAMPLLHTLTLCRMTFKHAYALTESGSFPSLRCITLAHSRHTESYGERGYDRLMEGEWWSQIVSFCSALAFEDWRKTAESASVYHHLAAHAERLSALKHLIIADDMVPSALFEADLFQTQITRLSFAGSAQKTMVHTLEHLDAQPNHSVRVVDVSRIVPRHFHRVLWNLDEIETALDAIVERLLMLKQFERLDEVVIPGALLSDERLVSLRGLSKEANVVLTEKSWYQVDR